MSPQHLDSLAPVRGLVEAWRLFGEAGGERPDWQRFLPAGWTEREQIVNLCLADIECRLTVAKEHPPLAQEHAEAARSLGLDDNGQFELLRFEHEWCCRENGKPPSKEAYLRGCPQLASRIEGELVQPVAAPGDTTAFPRWFGRFRLDGRLGEGGMGDVFLAYDARLCCTVALKIPRIAAGDDLTARRFRREARIGSRLRHPFLCRVHEHSKIGGVRYLTMPVIEGKPLSELVSPEQPWEETRAAELIRRLATALQALHEGGVIHRDLKPKNVLVQDDDQPMLMDFGLARSLRPDRRQLTLSRQTLGTPAYMSPEMVQGRHREVGPATDVYGLGTILYELLTGRVPFRGRTIDEVCHRIVRRPPQPPSERRSGLSTALEAICLKALAKRPRDRHQDMEELEGELAAFLGRPGTGYHRSITPDKWIDIPLSFGIDMRFAWCPPGTFLMGSPANEGERDDRETQHRVTLTKGYWLGVYPVTQAQWQAVMGTNPSQFKGQDTLPVETVSWDDCQEFCKNLGQKTGKRFRLPTEAEWEYACRAGTTTPFHFGETISTSQANFDGNYTYGKGRKGVYREKTTPVGSFPANAWGLFDMHGNVWEWCQDWSGFYPSGDIVDPCGGNNDVNCIQRGGSWYSQSWICRSAYRSWDVPGSRSNNYGCRVLLCLD